jgi:hypothetical protein
MLGVECYNLALRERQALQITQTFTPNRGIYDAASCMRDLVGVGHVRRTTFLTLAPLRPHTNAKVLLTSSPKMDEVPRRLRHREGVPCCQVTHPTDTTLLLCTGPQWMMRQVHLTVQQQQQHTASLRGWAHPHTRSCLLPSARFDPSRRSLLAPMRLTTASVLRSCSRRGTRCFDSLCVCPTRLLRRSRHISHAPSLAQHPCIAPCLSK